MDDAAVSARDGAIVGASDIARLTNMGRAAVSNWRRRFPDFPTPIGGSAASPLYSLPDIEAWLTSHDKRFTVSPKDNVWQRIRGAADDLRLGELVSYVGEFLVYLTRDASGWRALSACGDDAVADASTGAIVAAVPELPAGLPRRPEAEWVGILRLVATAAGRRGHRELFDFLCERYLEAQPRRISVTPVHLAQVMVGLADVKQATMLDPACGVGNLLLAADEQGAAGLVGQDVDPTAARLCTARLLLRERPVHMAVGDSLRHDAHATRRVDVVMCNPPFGDRSWGHAELTSDPRWEFGLPPRGESELAWVQHCLAHVIPGGRVVITMPSGAATRRAGRRIRANLLRSGTLRAVISMPAAGPSMTTGTDVWILRRPLPDERDPTQVLMVDATNDLSAAERAWRSFLADPHGAASNSSAVVRIIDLLDDDVDISPAHRLARDARLAEPARFARLQAELATAVAALAADLPTLTAPPEREPMAMTTLGELVKAGVVAIHQAPLRMTTDSGDTPVLTAHDVRRRRPPSGRSTPEPGSVTVQPGDVVIPLASRQPITRVTDDGGYLLGPQLLLFRPDPDRIDAYFLAGFVRASQEMTAAHGSSLAIRSDARRTPIPRLALGDQRRYGDDFRRLMRLADGLACTTSMGEDVVRLGIVGLADGSLTPPTSDELFEQSR